MKRLNRSESLSIIQIAVTILLLAVFLSGCGKLVVSVKPKVQPKTVAPYESSYSTESESN